MRKYPEGYSEIEREEFDEIIQIAKGIEGAACIGVEDDNPNGVFIEVDKVEKDPSFRDITMKFNNGQHSLLLRIVLESENERGKRYVIV